jgi:hypothetical protein
MAIVNHSIESTKATKLVAWEVRFDVTTTLTANAVVYRLMREELKLIPPLQLQHQLLQMRKILF